MMKRFITLALIVVMLFSCVACKDKTKGDEEFQFTSYDLVKDGASDYSVLVPANADENALYAASELIWFFREATGVTLGILRDDGSYNENSKCISIGETPLFLAQHAEVLGVGSSVMAKKGEFWLTVHTRVDLFERAYLMDELTVRTWAEACSERDVRTYRSYTLSRGEAVIARGKTAWAILGPEQKIIRFGDSGFPKDYPFPAETAIPEKLQRFHEKFEDADLFSHYAVRSTDIDLGHHMNNVAYVRLLLDCFSAKELASGNIQSVELHYSTPCFEGEALTVYKKSLDDGTCRIGIVKPDGKTASQACVTFKK